MRDDHASRARIAAVICTRNRSTLLSGTLESLCTQTLDKTAYEVVIVDDGSTDDTRQVIDGYSKRLPLIGVYQRHAGLASAKNVGLFSTRAPLVIFLDDDDVASSTLLEQHLETHERFPGDRYGVLGYTMLDASLKTDPLMYFLTEVGCYLFSYPKVTHGQLLDYTHFWGGRSSCKRSFLLDHGIFNPVFRFGCEDIELGFRLSRHDFAVTFNRHAVSMMVRQISLAQICERLAAQGRSNVVFSRLHGDPAVQRWTQVAEAQASWGSVGPAYDAIVRSARHLDTLVRRKRQWGLQLNDLEIRCLHRAYWSACRAALFKGINEKLMEMDS